MSMVALIGQISPGLKLSSVAGSWNKAHPVRSKRIRNGFINDVF